MSESLLYHGFGLRGYTHLKTELEDSVVTIHLERKDGERYCAQCKSKQITKKGKVIRRLKTVPIGDRQVYLQLHLHRHFCAECGSLRLEPLKLSSPKRRWTNSLRRYILGLLRFSTVEDVAKHLKMSWDTIKGIHLTELQRKFPRRQLGELKYLGIDEVAVLKGHKYMTVVVNLETGEVVWVAEGRERASLEPFFQKLKRKNVPIKAIATDMYPAYISIILEYFSSKVIVFDHFHVVSAYNKALDDLRRQQFSANYQVDRRIFVGTRFLLLKGREKIQTDKQAKAHLQELLNINQPLNAAYLLKEELRQFWICKTFEDAKSYLNNWLKKVWAQPLPVIHKVAKMIAAHKTGILNYFHNRISTGKVEGINNKIKTLKRKAYGFRDLKYFKLRIYALHETRYALVG